MTRANANALFAGLKTQQSFNNAIHIQSGDPEDKALISARSKIRAQLRSSFKGIKSYLRRDDIRKVLFVNRGDHFHQQARKLESIDVRFLTQGSHAYGTLIRPAQPQFQEIDLDDGVYVPMPFVEGRPIFSSAGLFEIIQRVLDPLVEREGWHFVRKDTCVRICLPGQNAHIDLPLFAVDINEFVSLANSYKNLKGEGFRKTRNLNEVFDTEARNIRLAEGRILLADREMDWRPSDPKAIHDWFIEHVKIYGNVLRRSCRYIKGWRDETWQDCNLKSLALMVASVDIIKALDLMPSEERDDLIMLRIAEALPDRIRKGHLTWREGQVPIDENWPPEEREQFAVEAEKLAKILHSALEDVYHPEIIVRHLRDVFGERFPDAPESISLSEADQTGEVLETKASTVAMPLVGTSVSA